MERFLASFIVPLAVKRGWTNFCEIGASLGLGTDRLLTLPDVSITVIDPCLDLDLSAKYAHESRVRVCRGLSLDVLPTLDACFDCILVDGDHNWYTVYEELRVIREKQLLKPGGVIFSDDIEWPYGRRDMYYQPEMIPASYRHQYARRGMLRGRRELSAGSGLNGELCNALLEGGARNGVLTAVEDFLREHRGEYRFFRIQRDTGLGTILNRRSPANDFWFLVMAWKSTAYNLLTWPKRFARTRMPSAYQFAKSVFRQA
jgi:SAM-dependent methyltransferase